MSEQKPFAEGSMPSFGSFIDVPNDFALQSSGAPTGEIPLPDGTRGLLIGTAGSLNVTMQNGEIRVAVPFQVGINPGRFKSIQTGGTAASVWAIL